MRVAHGIRLHWRVGFEGWNGPSDDDKLYAIESDALSRLQCGIRIDETRTIESGCEKRFFQCRDVEATRRYPTGGSALSIVGFDQLFDAFGSKVFSIVHRFYELVVQGFPISVRWVRALAPMGMCAAGFQLPTIRTRIEQQQCR